MQEELLLEMLEIALEDFNENEKCCYCLLNGCCDYHMGLTDDYCKSMLYEGLAALAKKRLKKQKNESGSKCA